MPILVTCPCGSQLRARDDQVGRQCKCPGCGSIITVPAPAIPAMPVQVEEEEPERIRLGYADTDIGRRADPLVFGGGEKPLPVIAAASADVAKLDRTWRGNVWWLLMILMIPLVFMSFETQPRPTLKQRIERTLAKNTATTQPYFGPEDEGYPFLDDAISSLPGQKLDGAFLRRHSVFPLLFALIASAAFLLLATYAIPYDNANPKSTLLTALFTATGGVLLLIGIQSFHLFCCIQAFYLAALHPDAPFGASLVGFVLGVGVCEEIIKCLPILFLMWRGSLMNWRIACIIGMASGAGFGISEALLYSFRNYNGIEPGDAYLLRYTSCIAFHTLLTGAAAILIQRKQEHLLEKADPINWTLTLMAIILLPIFLHGLFDTFAKKEMEYGALLVAVGSFMWLAMQIHTGRLRERSVTVALPAGPKVIKTAKGTRMIGPAPTPKRKA